MRISDVEAAERPEETVQHIKKIMEVGGDRFETHHRRKDGRIVDVEVSVNYIDAGGGRLFVFARDITERKRAEKELRERKEFTEDLIASMQDGFSVLDSHGVHIDVNPAFCQMTGFSREELIGVGTPHPYWPPEAYEEIEKGFQKTLRGEFGDVELTFMRKNSERFPVIVSPSWVKDKQGNVTSYFATVKDITERKRAEEEFLFTRFSLDNAAETMACISHDGRFIDVNNAFCRSSGYSREELLSMTVHDIDPDYSAEIWPEFWKKLKQSGSLTFETCHRNKEGRIFPVEITANFLEYNGKEYHCSFARDITERKRTEEVLQESEERYRLLFENSLDAILLTVPDGRILKARPPACTIFGRTEEELIQLGRSGVIDTTDPRLPGALE